MAAWWSVFFRVVSDEVGRMWWFVLLSILVAALIKTFRIDMHLRMLLQNRVKTGIFFATLVGLACPLCSCGILPIVVSLAAAGVPLPPLAALMFTSPVMGPEALVVTYGGLGLSYAVIKVVTAMAGGLGIGAVFLLLDKTGMIPLSAVRLKDAYDGDGRLKPAFEIACANDFTVPTMTVHNRESRIRFFVDRFWDMGRFILLITAAAIVLEGIMIASITPNVLKLLLATGTFPAMVLASLSGAALPINQIAVVPIVKGLLDLGLPHGPAVTLMIAGPVVSIPTVFVLYRIFHVRVLAVFVVYCIVFSLASGVVAGFVLP